MFLLSALPKSPVALCKARKGDLLFHQEQPLLGDYLVLVGVFRDSSSITTLITATEVLG
jgi:hypothetical protein